MSLPIYNEIQRTGNVAVAIIQLLFKRKGWIFRSANGSNNYGVDCEIEIVDENQVTGKLIKCQIKGTKNLVFKEGSYS